MNPPYSRPPVNSNLMATPGTPDLRQRALLDPASFRTTRTCYV
jgi:hypothetical protein